MQVERNYNELFPYVVALALMFYHEYFYDLKPALVVVFAVTLFFLAHVLGSILNKYQNTEKIEGIEKGYKLAMFSMIACGFYFLIRAFEVLYAFKLLPF